MTLLRATAVVAAALLLLAASAAATAPSTRSGSGAGVGIGRRFRVAAFATPATTTTMMPRPRTRRQRSEVAHHSFANSKTFAAAASSSSSSPGAVASRGQLAPLRATVAPPDAATSAANGDREGGATRRGEGGGTSKLRRLKDRMWVRETLEDVTAAEFASSLSVEDEEEEDGDVDGEESSGIGGSSSSKAKAKIWQGGRSKKRKRAVDFDNVLAKLDARIEEMCVLSSPEMAKELNRTCHVVGRVVVASGEDGSSPTVESACYSLAEDVGMGSVVCTFEEREELLQRLVSARDRLVNFVEGSAVAESGIDEIPPTPASIVEGGGEEEEGRGSSATAFDPSLYVREDGTVDWDGALQDREALKKFGSAVWSRINGQDPEEGEGEEEAGLTAGGGEEFHAPARAVTAKIEETDAIREKGDELDRLREELRAMEKQHTALLNSAIGASSAVANVNLATVDPALRRSIRDSSLLLEAKEYQVTFQMLNYELERIYTYLEGELSGGAAKGYIPLQDRLNVAEFGLLESQADGFLRQIELGENLDGDVLAVVADQVVDFKRRLGIDYYVTGLTFDAEAIQVWLRDVWAKLKTGVLFYVKGTRLFADDVVFCSSLILRALGGYTLKPREVRTLRRTFKDTITFIPVVIILIIPLSPIGHVLVFGAIQRVFPDFFPSCFTERRQNLLELYESTEYSAVTINETWTQQLIRLSQATRILALGLFTGIYTSLGGVMVEKPDENNKEDDNNKSNLK